MTQLNAIAVAHFFRAFSINDQAKDRLIQFAGANIRATQTSTSLEGTALRCIPHSREPSEHDFVYVIDGPGNFSHVGRQGGKQLLSISIWNNPIIISHEIKHALGWGHEQQNPERDLYIEILFENIPNRNWGSFTIFDNGTEGPYDFDSMMHYGHADLARPTRKSILTRLAFVANQNVMGQRNHLSETDTKEIQNFYGNSSVRWCGVNRKPAPDTVPGCGYKCELQSDPTIGSWVPESKCKATSG